MVVLDFILNSVASGNKLLAVLVDPDKFEEAKAEVFLSRLPAETSIILVGGSTVKQNRTEAIVHNIKLMTDIPVILFPGDYSQITRFADAILFLSLISGRNPEYLIGQQVKAAPLLYQNLLEVIPTGYILVEGGRRSAVERVSNTDPIPQRDIETIVATALAGEYSGKKVIYLEAGSGADFPVSTKVISEVNKVLRIPLVVGGGIRTREDLNAAYAAGADMVVIGTAFESGNFFVNEQQAQRTLHQ